MPTTYICKCGRIVTKSTNADNTGNRNTDGCEGCPYLLPWRPMVWDERQKAYTQDVKGQECRMSPIIEYATTYYGRAEDKCSLHIVSLDLDFLDEVQAWIYDHANETLRADFSRGSMRGIEFSDKGRYSLSVLCAQNKKGVAAKAALLAEFFGPDKRRLDMTPEQEKAHILAAIEAGKTRAQRKDTAMKKMNDRCPLQQECERTCKVIGHERDCDYYVNNRYGTDGIPDQDEILEDEDRRMEMELEEKRLAAMSIEQAKPIAYCNEYGTIFAVREHKGAPDLMCKPKGADTWTLSGVLAAVKGEAYTTADLQEVLDEYARAHRWQKVDVEEQVKSDEDVLTTSPERIERKESVCVSKTTFAPSGAAAVTTDGSAAAKCGVPDAETRTTPADASGAQPPRPLAQPVPLQPEHATATAPAAPSAPAFDYSGLDDQTVADLHLAEREYAGGKKMAEMGLRRMADAVAIAHDALCGACDKMSQAHNNQYSENTFGRWCESMGLNRKAAERLLQVSKLMDNSSPREQKVLEELTPSVLYEASRPSAEPEAVEALKSKQVTTLKEYRALEAQIKAEREAREKAEQEVALASEREEKARAAAHQYHVQYEEANGQRNRLLDEQGVYISRITEAEERAKAAEAAAREAEKQRDGARDALQAAKLRGDQWQEKAEARQARIQELESRPIQTTAMDSDEVDRLVAQRLDEELAKQTPRRQEEQEQAARDAYDAFILTARSLDNLWKALKPQISRLAPEQKSGAENLLLQKLMEVKEELIHACENCQP